MKSQLGYAVEQAVSFGVSKRSVRADSATTGGIEDKIFSLARRNDMRKFADELGKFIMQQYPEVRRAVDIKPEHIEAFLEKKAGTCKKITMQKIRSNVRKMEAVAKSAFGDGINWGTQKVTLPQAGEGAGFEKNMPLPMHQSAAIVEVMKEKAQRANGSQAWRGVEVGRWTGMRINEVAHLKVENIHLQPDKGDTRDRWGFGYVHVLKGPQGGAKGGRERYIAIPTQEAQEALKTAIRGLSGDAYVVTNTKTGGMVDPDTISASMDRAMQALGIKDTYKGDKMHGCRKAWAQKVYDQLRHEGNNRQQAKAITNELLGHSGDREVIKRYVGDIW